MPKKPPSWSLKQSKGSSKFFSDVSRIKQHIKDLKDNKDPRTRPLNDFKEQDETEARRSINHNTFPELMGKPITIASFRKALEK